VIPDPVKRDHNGVIWIDDWRYCDQCGSGVTVGTDAEAIALAVALIQATPNDKSVPVFINGNLVMFAGKSIIGLDAYRVGLELIRASGMVEWPDTPDRAAKDGKP
jgi:hypothetical protein